MSNSLLDDVKQKIQHKQRVRPLDLLIFMMHEPNEAKSRDINNILEQYNDAELFYIYTLAKSPATEILRATNDELKGRYIKTCLKNKFANRQVYSMMYHQGYPMNKIANFCVDSGYQQFVNHVQYGDVAALSHDEFSSFYAAVRTLPGYNSAKAFMLARDDLTLEQKIYGVKNLANCGCPLPEPYLVGFEELDALSLKMLVRLLEDRVCSQYKDEVRLHPDITMKQVKKLLFPLMMEDERRYSALIRKLNGEE